jgi:cytochrome c oxidase subunit 2
LLNAPPIARADDWYILSSLKKFKGGIRGSNPKDITGAQMIGMAGTLPDEQAMLDVIAHIKTLSK